MKLARRLSVIEPSPTLAVSAKAAKLKAAGVGMMTSSPSSSNAMATL